MDRSSFFYSRFTTHDSRFLMSSEDVRRQPEAVREAFEQEFGRFARFRGGGGAAALGELTLSDAEAALRELAELRTRHAGKKSALGNLKKLIGRVPAEERAAFGQDVQAVERDITAALEETTAALEGHVARLRVERERLDVTLPGRRPRRGHLHPVTLVRQRIEDIFVSMGYSVEDGPEIETDFFNFTALNIPELHPARSVQDTFYTDDGLALRSQTST